MDFFPLQPSCISPALWKQEQSRAAKQRNALARQKHSEVLAEGRGDSSLVPHRQTLDFDTSGLADDKYAIAESILEAERKSCPGWMQTKHVEFEREHGQLMQLAEEAESDAEDETHGEYCQCPIDLCARDAERLDDYQTWFHQCREVLRVCRNTRKAKGFVPDHPLVVVIPPDVEGIHDLKCGDEVYLFAKVAFSPFDATLVKLKLERLGLGGHDSPSPWVARMHPTNEGLPDMMSLDLFLKQCCESFDGESDKLQILHYSGGRKFGELDIQSMEAIEQALRRAAPEVVARDADLEEEQRAAKKRSDLLRKVLAAGTDKNPKHAKAKPKAGTVPRPKAVKKPTKQTHSKKSHREGQDPDDSEDHPAEEDEDPDEPGFSGAMHRTIEREWAGALEGDLPQASSSSSSSSSHGPGHPPVQDQPVQGQPSQQPAAGSTLPWKDSSGYCFLPKDGNAKGTHLGAQLSTLNSTRLPWP